jgi:aryl-alcohol dehydrogenase-like predicted oxidoreductase/predicted kinase
MRLTTRESPGVQLAAETIAAAAGAGITVFDTARAYAPSENELGLGERLLAAALGRCDPARRARIVTKGGMSRAGGVWVPDGRAKAILADCEASLAALDGRPIDLYLLHAPDPRTPLQTSVRALARLADEGLVNRVGLSNVNRRQLDDALGVAPVSAIEVSLSLLDDRALRGGLVDRCAELGITLIAHSPLGGLKRAGGLSRRKPLVEVAEARGATPAEVALAWLLALSPLVVAIPGARRPATARSAARAATLSLTESEHAALSLAFGGTPALRATAPAPAEDDRVVLIMGIPGAGKSRVAGDYVARGYVRLNRDERGGGLRELAAALDAQLSSGARRVVLDNTYLSRSSRSYVIDVARVHRVSARCIWLSTPLAQAQVNLVERLLEHFGTLPTPEQLRVASRSEAGVLAPTSQMRALRELEPPSSDEGFSSVEVADFVRARTTEPGRPGVFVAAAALRAPDWEGMVARCRRDAPHLIFDWRPDGTADEVAGAAARLSAVVSGPVHGALCPHPGGPPICWCRPPLPGLPLAFAKATGVDPSRSMLIGSSPAHRTLATTLGAVYVPV